MSQFVIAKRDTFINRMSDVDVEFEIPKGKWMFHITSPNQTKYLEPREIAVWNLDTGGVCFGHEGDWVDCDYF